MGESDVWIDIEENMSVQELWQLVSNRKEIELENIMMAVNREYVKPEQRLGDGDEVAFFPPVTGG